MKAYSIPCMTALLLLVAAGPGTVAAQSAKTIAGAIIEHETGFPAEVWSRAAAVGNAQVPDVPERFQRNFGRAWTMAEEGRAPTQICGGLFNGAAAVFAADHAEGADLGDAMAIMDACYTGVMTAYLSGKLHAVSDAKYGCIGEMTAAVGHRNVTTSMLRDVDPEGQIMAYLDARLASVMGELVHKTCPTVASIILVSAQ